MRRRDVLRLGAAVPAALASRRARGQTKAIERAAIVIGVDRPKGLPPLRGAASGATKIGQWLKSQGFEVAPFIDVLKDDKGGEILKNVKVGEIYDAIEKFVGLGTLKQLLVYFAGHGSYVGTGDFWLLSDALHDSNQAINLRHCEQFSRQLGVPNVILISDTCRSTSASLGIQSLTGYNIFPRKGNYKVHTFLDQFWAVREGDVAYEVKVQDAAGKYDGIYTTCFLDAFFNPDPNMIDDVRGVKVVLNKKLERYLLSEVPRRAQISDVDQYPDSSVTSPEYIGRAEIHDIWSTEDRNKWPPVLCAGGACACAGCFGGTPWPWPNPLTRVPLTIDNLVESKLSEFGVEINRGARPGNVSPAALQKIDEQVGFSASTDLILKAQGPNVFRYGTGVNVFGARLAGAMSSVMQAKVISGGDGANEPTVVEIDPRAADQDSIALEFEDGRGTVIAALRGYAVTVVADNGKVISVSYEPAQIGDVPVILPTENERVKQLRALVATSTRFGALRIDGQPEVRNRNAANLADLIRIEKAVDPTLGIYAAYAYAAAALPEQVRSVHESMGFLGIKLFDVAMLADVLSDVGTTAPAPFCPMLNQGWQFLGVKNVKLPDQLSAAQRHIIPSLWTTFDSEGMTIVKAALRRSTSHP
jgi:hypothetical protein